MMKQATVLLFSLLFGFFHCSASDDFIFASNKTKNGGYLLPDFIEKIIATFSPDILLETGTFDGGTAAIASPYFKEIHTVELSLELYNEAKNRLAAMKNVTLYHDGSPEMIQKVLPGLKGRVLFWLDAHYSSGKTALSNSNLHDPDAFTAIRRELQAIKECGVTDCVILVDDMRFFGTVINGVQQLSNWAYPSIQEICRLGREINPDFSFVLLGDMLLMYDSAKFAPKFSPVVQACTTSRLYNGSNLSDQELLRCEQIIMGVQGEERAVIAHLYQCNEAVLCHDLWYGLVSMGSNNWREAASAMEKVQAKYRYDHWRIRSYLSDIRVHL